MGPFVVRVGIEPTLPFRDQRLKGAALKAICITDQMKSMNKRKAALVRPLL